MIKILTRAPKEYLEQGLIHCGAFSVKAILSAYNKDVKNDPRDYYTNFIAKYTAIMTGPNMWLKVLRSYRVSAEVENVKKLSDENKIEVLKKLLNKNNPVILRVGNGYSKSGRYHSFFAHFAGHWITLWGYNDEEKVFYVYDSYVALSKHDKTIPIGNTKRTFQEILRDWNKGFPWWWRYNYIKVDTN